MKAALRRNSCAPGLRQSGSSKAIFFCTAEALLHPKRIWFSTSTPPCHDLLCGSMCEACPERVRRGGRVAWVGVGLFCSSRPLVCKGWGTWPVLFAHNLFNRGQALNGIACPTRSHNLSRKDGMDNVGPARP